MKVNANTIVGIVIALVFVSALFGILNSVIPTAATSFHNLSDTFSTGGTIYGTDAAAFGGKIDDYMGWFWILGPFVLAIFLVIGLFISRGYGRRHRRY